MQVLREVLSTSRHRILPSPAVVALNKTAQDYASLKYVFRGCKSNAAGDDENSAKDSESRSNAEASHQQQQEAKGESEGPDNPASAEPSLDERDSKIQQLEEERDEAMDRLKRSLADMENLRERSRREQESAHKYAVGNFARELLDVADNLRRALSTADIDGTGDHSDDSAAAAGAILKSLLDGVKMTESQLQRVFEKHGVQHIATAVGDPFDHNLHQALFEVADASKGSGTIAHIAKDGYTIHGRVLRPAEVGVVKNEDS